MRTLAALILLAPVALAQDAPAAPPAAPELPKLVAPANLPGEALPQGAEWQTTPSGLRYAVISAGDTTKPAPGPTDKVSVYYAGFLEDGMPFDKCVAPAQPTSFGVKGVIKGWTEGLQLMHPGAKYKFHVPYQLGYGTRGSGGKIPAKANLLFDVELLTVTPDPTPKFVMPAESELTATPSGLKYQMLQPGKEGGKKPLASDSVTVNYAGWLTDGKPFDSSYGRAPATFPLGGVIKGWTEGVQLMQEGAIYRFVIPSGLAYGAAGRPGIPPNATLVFQIELLKIGG